MPFDLGHADRARPGRLAAAIVLALCCLGPFARTAPAATEPAATEPEEAVLLDHLCARDLRRNEEDRLFGLISLTVRATLGDRHLRFSPGMIDGSVQDSLGALLGDCGRLVTLDPAQRLGAAIATIRGAALARLAAHRGGGRADALALAKATAADLSEDMASSEIDSWLDGLSPRERALALFLYASDVTPTEVADAVGMPLRALPAGFAAAKAPLLALFREREDGAVDAPGPGAAIENRTADISAAALLQPDPRPHRPARALRVTGISSDLYAGWSLLAIAVGLPPGENLAVARPFLLAGDIGGKRYIVVASAEISVPDDPIRRFLLKAYAIDGGDGDAGFHDTLHLAADHVDNKQALATLHNPDLSNIEIARCLWHDYGTGPDPGLCR